MTQRKSLWQVTSGIKKWGKVTTAMENLDHYFQFYNNKRRHQALGYKTPAAVYRGLLN